MATSAKKKKKKPEQKKKPSGGRRKCLGMKEEWEWWVEVSWNIKTERETRQLSPLTDRDHKYPDPKRQGRVEGKKGGEKWGVNIPRGSMRPPQSGRLEKKKGERKKQTGVLKQRGTQFFAKYPIKLEKYKKKRRGGGVEKKMSRGKGTRGSDRFSGGSFLRGEGKKKKEKSKKN